jgi:hypothetical protein
MAAVRALPVRTSSVRRCPARLSGCLGYASSTTVTSVEQVTMVELTDRRLRMGTSQHGDCAVADSTGPLRDRWSRVAAMEKTCPRWAV